MAKIRINGDTSGYIELSAPAVAGSTSITLPATTGGSLLATDANGNLNVDSGVFYVDGVNNRVGIGTTSPGYLLSVQGRISYNGAIGEGSDITLSSLSTTLILGESATWQNLAFRTNGSERFRCDSSGRLIVGTSSTSTTTRALIQGNSSDSVGTGVLFIASGKNNPTSSEDLALIRFGDSGHARSAEIGVYRDGGTWTSGTSQPTRLTFSTAADGASNPTERMRITSTGGVAIGDTTNQSAKLHVVGAQARTVNIRNQNNASSGDIALYMTLGGANTSNNNSYYLYCDTDNVGIKAQIYGNGGFANYQSNDANLCDEREKKNIESLSSTWDCLKHWEVKKFHYNEDDDTSTKRYGVIAQQIENHCPEVITDWNKGKDELGNDILRKGVKEQQMYWMAIKALQEAQLRIEQLEATNASFEARLSALEVKP